MNLNLKAALIIFPVFLAGCATSTGFPPTPPYPDPSLGCINRLGDEARFSGLVGKLQLRIAGPSFSLMTNRDRPTEEERSAIVSWMSARQHCLQLGEAWRAEYELPIVNEIQGRGHSKYFGLVAQLYNGEITYGEFERKRADLNVEVSRELDRVYARLQADLDAAQQQNAMRALMLNQSRRPTTTTCQIVLSKMVCDSR